MQLVQLDHDLAALLRIPVGAPALQLQRTYTTSDGEVAQVTINTHPAARFQHAMTLRRARA